MRLLYSVCDHRNILLENDDDFCNMMDLAAAYGARCVEVSVEDGNCRVSSRFEIGESSSSNGNGGVTSSSHSEIVEDPLEKFCPHHETKRLSADWAYLISHVGQEFRGGVKDFRLSLCKYAIEVGFRFKYLKNDQSRVTAECAFKADGCKWFVHAILDKSNQFFCIKELEKEHRCGATICNSKNSRMSSKLVAEEVLDEVRSKASYKPIDAVRFFRQRYGTTIGYHHAWLGIEMANNDTQGDYALSFNKLRLYAEVAKEKNPGSVVDVECCEDNRFRRLFVAFDACIKGFNYCRPFLCLDGTFLTGRYKGTVLAAVGKDADNGLFPVAYGVVDSETDDNWLWFLLKLRSILSARELTFITDRHTGLVKHVPEVFSNGYHSYCLQHLKNNLRDRMSGRAPNGFRERVVSLFNDCALAPTVLDFKNCVNELFEVGGDRAKEFVASIPVYNWANAYFPSKRYGEMTSNAVESFNNWIVEARKLPVLKCVDTIRVQIMTQMCERKQLSRKLNSVLCPEYDAKLREFFNKGRTWTVFGSSDEVFEVSSLPAVVVDIRNRTCTCCRWQLYGFPCVHAFTALQKNGIDVSNYIDPLYTADAFRFCYDCPIHPVPISTLGVAPVSENSAVILPLILPPKTRRPRGRPKVARIRSRGEKVRQIRCGRCKKLGNHNRKRCKEACD
ncbi:uncharacterized protein LOC131326208 [Rhododendron vialii]|uniref:uncharacterized protein LOC131326208 n=1 Tax=Rhododendron vialii TaxID=182163 RepID=UPI00265F684B|nr:uncharacterized protein LOC131326208 [Rhododendron vialii]